MGGTKKSSVNTLRHTLINKIIITRFMQKPDHSCGHFHIIMHYPISDNRWTLQNPTNATIIYPNSFVGRLHDMVNLASFWSLTSLHVSPDVVTAWADAQQSVTANTRDMKHAELIFREVTKHLHVFRNERAELPSSSDLDVSKHRDAEGVFSFSKEGQN